MAWDASTGKKVWEIKEHFPNWSGALVTAGDVAFYGTLDGWFKAVDARTGKLLSKFKVGSGVVGNPITYRGPDGKQYVAVYAGIGGDWFLLAGDVRSDDPADVRPPSDPYKDIGRHTSQGGIVWIFGLEGVTAAHAGSGRGCSGCLAVLGCNEGTGVRRSTGRTPAVSSEDRISAGGVLPAANALCRAAARQAQPRRRRRTCSAR